MESWSTLCQDSEALNHVFQDVSQSVKDFINATLCSSVSQDSLMSTFGAGLFQDYVEAVSVISILTYLLMLLNLVKFHFQNCFEDCTLLELHGLKHLLDFIPTTSFYFLVSQIIPAMLHFQILAATNPDTAAPDFNLQETIEKLAYYAELIDALSRMSLTIKVQPFDDIISSVDWDNVIQDASETFMKAYTSVQAKKCVILHKHYSV